MRLAVQPIGPVGFGFFSLLAGTAWQVVSVITVAPFFTAVRYAGADASRWKSCSPAILRRTFFLLYVGIGGLFAATRAAERQLRYSMLLDRQADSCFDAHCLRWPPTCCRRILAVPLTLTLVPFRLGLAWLYRPHARASYASRHALTVRT